MSLRAGPLMSFVVPVRNDADGLRRCLSSILRDSPSATSIEIIVVDNGSTDGSAEVAARAGATVLSLPGLRVGELRNRGVAAARGALIGFVDADHEIRPGWIEAAFELLDDPGIGAVGAPCQPPAPGTWVQNAYGLLRGTTVGRADVEWLGSGNMVVRREAFHSVGGFDTGLETCEDVDLCRRLRLAGWRIVSDQRLASVHHGDPATLRQLFRGELWRGRNNLPVSLRGPLTLMSLPSIVIPLFDLFAILAAVAGLLMLHPRGLLLSVLGVGTVVTFSTLRSARMVLRSKSLTPVLAAQAWIVAFVYDLARTLALVIRRKHRST